MQQLNNNRENGLKNSQRIALLSNNLQNVSTSHEIFFHESRNATSINEILDNETRNAFTINKISTSNPASAQFLHNDFTP